MVGKIIRDFLEGGGRKLTVPGFGTFMRRDGGEVIFVDLLRGDDRVLAGMVQRAGGLSEVEAAARIDRFIFETRAAIERTGRAEIAGLGTMTADAKGVYRFDYSPTQAAPTQAAPAQARPTQPQPMQSQAAQATPMPPMDNQPRAQSQAQSQSRPPQPQPRPVQPQSRPLQSVPQPNPHATHSQPQSRPAQTHPQARPQDGAPQRGAAGVPSRAQGVAPNKVQGGAPNRAQSAVPNRAHGGEPSRGPANAPRRGPAPTRRPKPAAKKSSTTDRVLLIAIIAAAIALAAMIFGLTSSASHIPFVNK